MQKVLVLHDFMLKDKKLKGAKLLVFAFIYSYAQIPNSSYLVSWSNAIKFLGISKSAYFDALKWLLDNNYLKNDFSHIYGTVFHGFSDKTLNTSKFANYSSDELCKIARYKWVK